MAPTLRWISVALLATSLLPVSPLHAENVFRWLDDEGEVHYGATVPPEFADKPYEVINESGIVLERIDPMAVEPPKEAKEEKPEPLFTEEEVRLRTDRLLVLKYHSEDDIFEAMEVEIANLGYDARILNQARSSLLKSLAAQAREAADRQRAGMPADAETVRQVEQLQRRLRQGANSLAALQVREDQVRAIFMADLERYQFLQNGGRAGSLPDG